MGQILSALVIAILGVVCLIALFFVLGVLFPRQVENTHTAAEAEPGRAFLVGLVNLVFLSALVLALASIADKRGLAILQLLALLILALLVVGVTFGLSGMAHLVGQRILPERSGMQRTLWGSLALILASLTPFVGWFGLFPYVGMQGLGGFVLGLFSRRRSELTPDVEAHP
jgi:hypothetical protein